MVYSYNQLKSLWIQAGGPRGITADIMAAVALAESGGNTNDPPHLNSNGSTDYGLWQINSVHGYNGNLLQSDPLYNAKAAVSVWHSQGYDAWTTYKDGRYLNYMPNSSQYPGLVNPVPNAQFIRVDQGVDYGTLEPVRALASGVIEFIDPNFYNGTPAIYEKLDHPITVDGQTYEGVYYSETGALVSAHQRVAAGQPVEKAGAVEIGFASNKTGSWLPAAHGQYTEGHPTQAGEAFKALMGQIGADTSGVNPNYVPGVTQGINAAKKAASGFGSGIQAFGYQALFVIIGLGLIMVGLALIAWTVMGRTGAPGVIGMAQSQMRIRQAGRRIEATETATTTRAQLRTRSQTETERAARVRETQASERLAERQKARELSERRLAVHEAGVQRREPRTRKFTDVKRDDRTAARKKPGRKVSGVPKKS